MKYERKTQVSNSENEKKLNWDARKERESTVRKQNEELKINITIKITRCD